MSNRYLCHMWEGCLWSQPSLPGHGEAVSHKLLHLLLLWWVKHNSVERPLGLLSQFARFRNWSEKIAYISVLPWCLLVALNTLGVLPRWLFVTDVGVEMNILVDSGAVCSCWQTSKDGWDGRSSRRHRLSQSHHWSLQLDAVGGVEIEIKTPDAEKDANWNDLGLGAPTTYLIRLLIICTAYFHTFYLNTAFYGTNCYLFLRLHQFSKSNSW